MAIPFGGTITIYTGVPLNNKYEHTFASNSFISASASSSRTFSAQSYSRVSENKIRVEYEVSSGFNPYNATYLLIRNPSYNTNKYYCFVTDVHYVNDRTVEITFEIDVIQTWLFGGNATIRKCFIEREHQNDDTIGANIIPESVSLGETKEFFRGSTQHGLSQPFVLTFDCNVTADGTEISGENIQGLVYQVGRTEFNLGGGQLEALDWLRENGAKLKENFIGCRLTPSIQSTLDYGSLNQDILTISRPTTIDGYTPTNNKLFTAPFLSIMIKTPYGQQKTYAYEFFKDGEANFRESVGIEPTSTITLAPSHYNGNSAIQNIGDGVSLGNFPIMPTTTSSYETWASEKFAGVAGDLISTLGAGVAGFAVGSLGHNPVTGMIGAGWGIVSSLAGKIGGAISEANTEKLHGADVISGGSGSIRDYQLGVYNFFAFDKAVNAQTAKTIDDYFTMFGYKQNKLDYPKYRNTRFDWHYVKTIGCNVQGDCPASDLAKIATIMDNGITFWNTDKIGNYVVGD